MIIIYNSLYEGFDLIFQNFSQLVLAGDLYFAILIILFCLEIANRTYSPNLKKILKILEK